MKRLELYFHDNCFDGAASAALFAAFYRDRHGPAEVVPIGMQHSAGDPFANQPLSGDDNACVDFRFSPRLSWWFDHHASAFQPPELREAFEAGDGGQWFYDPQAPSCTGFIAGVLRDQLGWTAPEGFAEVVEWADIIDAARYPDAKTAVEVAAPAMKLATWLEHNHDPARTRRLIDELGTRPLAAIADEAWVAEPLGPILEEHERTVSVIRACAEEEQGVVFFDLIDRGTAAYNKFIPYLLYPLARYTVAVLRTRTRVKVSVGSNPWAPVPREHDIASICERYGGGGHPVVGAVSLALDQVERAREIAREVRETLATPPA